MKKRTKIWLGIVTLIIVLGLGGWGFLRSQVYQPSTAAQQVENQATIKNGTLVFPVKLSTKPTVIFYPGALVEPGSYSIWAKKVSDAGYRVSIVRFPLDLAVLAPNKAASVTKGATHGYVIGGHSLGGVMASRYAKAHSRRLKGVFFLASYPDQKGNLRATTVPVLSIAASRDGVLNWTAYKKAKAKLPKSTQYTMITGGNHAGFGSYGKQKGDNSATISNRNQQRQVAQDLIRWLNRLPNS
ncbi:alpha/beta hydrolase [Pediococcus siamensis]|uniref:alpha/beta hydrolase n=1 Tax=Pediococcus siamensis TaxID=381829 RepID=UPI0039A34304